MANRFAVASGNFNDTNTWSTTAAGAPGASVPVAGDNAIANNRTVTITANAACDNITNGTIYGGTAGGGFVLNDGVTLTAAVIMGTVAGTCISYSGSTSASIVGAITGGSTTTIGVTNSGTGTLNVTNAAPHTGRAFSNSSTGTISITGNCTATGSAGSTPLIINSAGGTITINGSLTGGSGGASHGVSNTSNGAVNVNGSVTGGSVANGFGINNTSTGNVTVSGTITATITNAIVSTTATVRASGSFIYAVDGTIPISAPRIILLTAPTFAKTRYALSGAGTYVDMFTADNSLGQASPSDVRSGVSYASGALTGTCAVPAAGSVALGVPVGNTTGTALLTGSAVATAVWDALTSSLTTSGSIGERIKNCSTAEITGEQLAAALSTP